MKILFVIDSMQNAGAARVVSILSNELLSFGYDVGIATNISSETIGYPLADGIKLWTIYSHSHLNDSKLKRLVNHVILLREVILHFKPDIIVGEQENGALYAKIANFGFGTPLIGHRHNSFKILGLSIIRKFIFNSMNATVLLHKTDLDFVKGKINNAVYIYNPCSFSINKHSFNAKKRQIVVVGSLDRWYNKGIDLMFLSWASLSNQFPDWNLVIVGDGPKEQVNYLKNLTEELHISSSTTFIGFRSNVDELFAESAIFALPSRVEGFPMVLNEAVSQGCACVAYSLFGVIQELYSENSVAIAPDGDVKCFTDNLHKLMQSEELRFSFVSEAQKEIEQYMPENITKEWINLFSKLSEDGGRISL